MEKARINDIDRTVLKDRLMPKSWTCPHCKTRQRTGEVADELLIEYGKYLQHCRLCMYVHIWELELSDEFKKQVVDKLVKGEL